jgi:hypothetical protein
MHEGLKEGTSGDDDGLRVIGSATTAAETYNPPRLHLDRLNHLLPERQVFLTLSHEFGVKLVRLFVALGPRTVHGRALASVEETELDGCGVG